MPPVPLWVGMIPLSRSAGYACLAMSVLNEPGGDFVLVEDIAARMGFPRFYIGKLMNRLKVAGFVHARRGHHGGVVLALPAKEISLALIAEAIDGREWRENCLLGFLTCSDERACPAHGFWRETRDSIHHCLSETTLEKIRVFATEDRI